LGFLKEKESGVYFDLIRVVVVVVVMIICVLIILIVGQAMGIYARTVASEVCRVSLATPEER